MEGVKDECFEYGAVASTAEAIFEKTIRRSFSIKSREARGFEIVS